MSLERRVSLLSTNERINEVGVRAYNKLRLLQRCQGTPAEAGI